MSSSPSKFIVLAEVREEGEIDSEEKLEEETQEDAQSDSNSHEEVSIELSRKKNQAGRSSSRSKPIIEATITKKGTTNKTKKASRRRH